MRAVCPLGYAAQAPCAIFTARFFLGVVALRPAGLGVAFHTRVHADQETASRVFSAFPGDSLHHTSISARWSFLHGQGRSLHCGMLSAPARTCIKAHPREPRQRKLLFSPTNGTSRPIGDSKGTQSLWPPEACLSLLFHPSRYSTSVQGVVVSLPRCRKR